MAEMPKEGFLKVVAPKRPTLSSTDKAALIRKGNQLYNAGDIDTAKKVFLSLGYTSGLIQIGDYHYEKGDFFEAYRMYSLAPAPGKVDYMIQRMADVVRGWINE